MLPIPAYPPYNFALAPTFVRMYGQCGTTPAGQTGCENDCFCFPAVEGELYNFIVDLSEFGLPNGSCTLDLVDNDCNVLIAEQAEMEILDGFGFITWQSAVMPDECFRLAINVPSFVGSPCNIGVRIAEDPTSGAIYQLSAADPNALIISEDEDFVISLWAATSSASFETDIIRVSATDTYPIFGVQSGVDLYFSDGENQVPAGVQGTVKHYVFARKGTGLYLYVNGVGGLYDDFTPRAIGDGNGFTIGQIADGRQQKIANLLIRKVSPTEDFDVLALALYNEGLCANYAPDAGDLGYWRFHDLLGSTSFYNERANNSFFVSSSNGAYGLNALNYRVFAVPGGVFPDVDYTFVTDCFCQPYDLCYTGMVHVTDTGRGVLPYTDQPDAQATYDQFAQRIRLPIQLIPTNPTTDGRVEVNSRRQTRTIHKLFRPQVIIDTQYMPTNVIQALTIAFGCDFFGVISPGHTLPLRLVVDAEPPYVVEGPRPYTFSSKLRQVLILADQAFKKDYC